MTASKQELTELFRGKPDRFWGVVDIPDGCGGLRSEFEGLGYSGVQCTGYACRVFQRAPDTRIMGYRRSDNPGALTNGLSDGHDFALVAGRYIVDPWLAEVEAGRITTHTRGLLQIGQIVFDLDDADDAGLALSLYGPRECWSAVSGAEASATADRSRYIESIRERSI